MQIFKRLSVGLTTLMAIVPFAFVNGSAVAEELGNTASFSISPSSGPASGGGSVNITPPPQTDITSISAGSALTSNGSIYTWGGNYEGWLGDGTTTNRNTPVRVKLPNGVKATELVEGGGCRYALASDGSVYAWGQGALGDGSKTDNYGSQQSSIPVRVRLPAGVKVSKVIFSGGEAAYALASDGSVYAWGWGALGDGSPAVDNGGEQQQSSTPVRVRLPSGTKAVEVSASSDNSNAAYALASDGSVYAWGWGALGDSSSFQNIDYDFMQKSLSPVKVKLPEGIKASQVIAGTPGGKVSEDVNAYAYALASDGSVYAWGGNRDGTIGDGTTTHRTTPVKVELPVGTKVTGLINNGECEYALTSEGLLYAWGDGDVGDGSKADNGFQRSSMPVRVQLPSNVKVADIKVSSDTVYVLGSDGFVYSWGSGMPGDGATMYSVAPVKVKIPAGVKAVKMFVGYANIYIRGTDGSLYGWGYNDMSQLGDGSNVFPTAPVKIVFPGDTRISQLVFAQYDAFALSDDGRVFGWGADGGYGDGSDSPSDKPVVVQFVSVDKTSFGGMTSSTPKYDSALGEWTVEAPAHALGKVDVTFSSSLAGQKQDPVTIKGAYTYTGKVPVYRLYNSHSGLHHYTINIAERDKLVSLGWNYEGESFDGVMQGAAGASPVYREYNPYDGNHNWTLNSHEDKTLVSLGWNPEGIAWYVPTDGTTPVYRLYNRYTGEHVYTIDKREYDTVVKAGWNGEGVAWNAWEPAR